MRFRPEQRLRFSYEFNKVRQSGEQSITPAFILQGFFPNEQPSLLPRLGVIASKRVGNAVKRNRGKRLLRDFFATNKRPSPATATGWSSSENVTKNFPIRNSSRFS